MDRRKTVRLAGWGIAATGALLIGWAALSSGWPVSRPSTSLPSPVAATSTPAPAPTLLPLPSSTLTPAPSPTASATRYAGEPIVPTPTMALTVVVRSTPVSIETSSPRPPSPGATATSARSGPATATPSVAVSPSAAPSAKALGQWRGHNRWGIGVANPPLSAYDTGALKIGWYLSWRTDPAPHGPPGADFAQMVRTAGGRLTPAAPEIAGIARSVPGSLWLIGNEPDVRWQDNTAPADYARLYHEAHTALKSADPSALVAIGGVSQPTPLRLRYLEAILASYRKQFGEPMPIDVWNVHNFVLREERDSWGVDIPPGMPDQTGVLYEIDDSGNLAAFRAQIVAFRRWMAERGFRDQPLIVSEYGIPMPNDYGFPPARVAAFLTATFDYFATATDPELGYPADGNRLVQAWCWFSLNDLNYPTGNLYDETGRELNAVGRGWAAWAALH